ncbi:uncharacterized protein LOC130902696 [Diorhabda carinulata]|uniref:uncharacterized protein LOC130902696 n=1 Tax=Diorhabda carinulata TaxID=1163345 RepID=UPI0025A0918B|nr:uncharacterized protein LOC130902696 [Diorhabda carinulata]
MFKLSLAVLLVVLFDIINGYTFRKGFEGSYSTGNDVRNRYLGFRAGDVEKKCVCMNWRACQGTIDSYPSEPCRPSYAFVCCIQPDPEPNPGGHIDNYDCQEDQLTELEIPGLELIPNPNTCD